MKLIISALKALGNAGISNNMNSILSRCMRDGDAETVSTALRSLRHFECSTERKRSSIALPGQFNNKNFFYVYTFCVGVIPFDNPNEKIRNDFN